MMGNVCQRAGEFMLDCMNAWCEMPANVDHVICAAMLEAEDLSRDMEESCDDWAAEQATNMLEQSCDEMLGAMGIR